MAEKSARHLRNYLIDTRLQLRHVGVVVVLSSILSAFLGWLIWLQRSQASQAIAKSLESAQFISAADKQVILAHVQGSDLDHVLRMAGVCVAAIALLSLFVVILSHKVAGPLHRVAAAIDALRDGYLPRIQAPRRGDELKRFFGKFKEMGDTLRARAEDDLAAYRAFSAACAEAPADGDLVAALAGLKNIEDELTRALAP